MYFLISGNGSVCLPNRWLFVSDNYRHLIIFGVKFIVKLVNNRGYGSVVCKWVGLVLGAKVYSNE